MATTPPFRSVGGTPSTPLHGARYDNHEPYAKRKSSRTSAHRIARTPSPDIPSTPQKRTSLRSKKLPTVRSAAHTYSPPSSTQASPQRKPRKVNHPQAEAHGSGVVSDGIAPSYNTLHEHLAVDPAMMLPTPAKTPKKKVVQPGLTSAARVLFPNRLADANEAMPTPTKHGRRPKKHTGFSLDGINDEEEAGLEEEIQIFTDSKDRLPEVDESEDNPFYVKPGAKAAVAKRSNKRRKVSHSSDHNEEVQEMLKREEGMVYVFRGKKIYRRFEVDPDEQESLQHAPEYSNIRVDEHHGGAGHRPRTRSSIKPRLLFPTKEQQQQDQPNTENSDEEAVTDIEEPITHASELVVLGPEAEKEVLGTPVRQTFTPSSPPSTGRATRATTRKAALEGSSAGPEPIEAAVRFKVQKGNASSPFNSWRITKATTAASGKGKKREAGDTLERDGNEGKKIKATTV